MAEDTVAVDPLRASLQIAGEYMLPLPGGSNLVKGDIKQAVTHAGLGIVARALLGPIGVLLVSANSLSVALTDRNLAEHFTGPTTSGPAVKSAK